MMCNDSPCPSRGVRGLGWLFSVMLLLVAACSRSEQNPAAPSASLTHVTMGLQVSPAMGLAMVAKEQGLFAKHGLDVEFKEFTAGKFALQAFIGGSLDYCISGEVPVALATLQGSEIPVVASVVRRTVNEVRVVALRDPEGALEAGAFFKKKKRRLATSIGGGPEFFTYKFLAHYGIGPDAVEIVSQAPQDMPAALKSKSVDAVAIFDPFAFLAERLVGPDGVTFANEQLYSEFYVLSASKAQRTQHPENIERVLRAMIDAGAFIKADPAKSKEAVARHTKLAPDVVDGVWKSFEFDAWLPASLLATWNEQDAWARKTGKVPPSTPKPDFKSIVDSSVLRRLRPEAVEF